MNTLYLPALKSAKSTPFTDMEADIQPKGVRYPIKIPSQSLDKSLLDGQCEVEDT